MNANVNNNVNNSVNNIINNACDVMFINLPMSQSSLTKTGRPDLVSENLGLAYMKANLDKCGISVKIADAISHGFSTEEILSQIITTQPRLVGLPIFQSTRQNVLAFCRQLKEAVPHIKIILGGHLARFVPEELFKYDGIDLLCMGEGEQIVAQVFSALDKGHYEGIQGIAWKDGDKIHVNPPAPFITDLDTIPWPARDTLPTVLQRGGLARIVTSRGCSRHCTFCSVHRFIGPSTDARWRTRTIPDVMEELDFLRTTYHLSVIAFNEDNFFGPGEVGYARAEELAQALLRKGWGLKFAIACRADDVEPNRFRLLKEAGLIAVEMGLESGAQTALNRWGKGIKVEQNFQALEILQQLGISVTGGFIMFDAHTTLEELQQSRAFLRRCSVFKDMYYKMELRMANKILPYVGTPIRTRYHRGSRLHSQELHSDAYDDYTFSQPIIQQLSQIMQHWETRSAAVRRLSWHLALDYPTPHVSQQARGLLNVLMELTMKLFEEALDKAVTEGVTWDVRADKPWPASYDTELNILAKELLTTMSTLST